jgi:hypothetical protein
MRDVAECIDEEAEALGAGTVYGVAKLLARAHHKAADRIEVWSGDVGQGGPVPVPPEFMQPGAGHKRTASER